jgi:hypothetical protein
MESSDALLTFAELGVALAGLGSLVAVFLRRSETGNELDMPRLWLVLEFGLCLTVFSILPLPIWQLGLAAEVAFKISGLLLALFLLAHIAISTYLAGRRPDLSASFPPVLGAAMTLGHLFFALFLVGASLGIGIGAAGAYLAGTSWLLIAAIVNFVRLVWVMAPR